MNSNKNNNKNNKTEEEEEEGKNQKKLSTEIQKKYQSIFNKTL